MKDIAVILPTLNEEKAIGSMIAAVKKALPDAKIIIADDGSADGTEKIVVSFPNVIFLDRKNEMQKGLCASVLDAIQKYPHNFYIVMDADGQHPAGALAELVKALDENAIIVMTRAAHAPKAPAAGFAAPGTRPAGALTPFRKFVSLGATMLARMRLSLCGRWHVKDPMSGFFAIGRNTALGAMAGGHFVKGGFKVLLDFLKSAPKDAKIAQLPYEMGWRMGGKSKLGMRQALLLLKSVFS